MRRYERESSLKESREKRIAEVTIAMEKLYPLIKDNIKKNRNSNKYAFDIFRDEYFNYFDYDYITINDLKSIAKYYRIFKVDGDGSIAIILPRLPAIELAKTL